ncbi:MAG: hypothetical protein HY466_02465 [Deltaproteobacteria bacterium]|nr:hypothetical protein [Deltaproteobacteria bacterium]
MVHRIDDKPEVPPAYTVKAPTESKKDKPREERRQEDLPTFKKQDEAALYREKFQQDASILKTVKIPAADIQSFLFKKAIPRHGAPMVDTELVLKDGKKIANVGFLLKGWQDFMRIKNLKPGEPVPEEFWNYQGPQVEITIRSITTSGPWNLREIERGQGAAPADKKKTISAWQYAAWGAAGLAVAAAAIWMMVS